jgi:hypothetical protein
MCDSVGASGDAQEEFEQHYDGGGDYQCQKNDVDSPRHIAAARAAT